MPQWSERIRKSVFANRFIVAQFSYAALPHMGVFCAIVYVWLLKGGKDAAVGCSSMWAWRGMASSKQWKLGLTYFSLFILLGYFAAEMGFSWCVEVFSTRSIYCAPS